MITKKQALEFISELSKSHAIYLDIPCGYAYIDKEEYGYRAWEDEHTLEALVTAMIKDNKGNAFLMDFDEIPVDVDMLEVGQTYKVFLSDKCIYGTSKLNKHTYLGEKDGYFMFERTEGNVFDLKQEDIEEIYKVNE